MVVLTVSTEYIQMITKKYRIDDFRCGAHSLRICQITFQTLRRSKKDSLAIQPKHGLEFYKLHLAGALRREKVLAKRESTTTSIIFNV